MASTFEKSVKGATKHKLAAPKAKYVEHILIATHAGDAGVAEVFRALQSRLWDSTWTTIFKALIVVHYMMREGEKDVSLRYLKRNPKLLALSHYPEVAVHGRNIKCYAHYLNERARGYGEVRTDFVRQAGEGRLRKLTVEKGLLREVECVQTQIKALLTCTLLDDESDNEITLLAFRLLVSDLLELFHVVNEGVINVLEHYFEMSRYDAERALKIYKVFTTQTADVVEYLQSARRVEVSTRLQIPNIKHAPTSLTSSLEEYLNDPDFDINRRQYLAQKEAKGNGGNTKLVQATTSAPTQEDTKPTAAALPKEAPKNAPDLIDFFSSIETEQTQMFNNQAQPQVVAVQQQQFPQVAELPPQMIGQLPQVVELPSQMMGQPPQVAELPSQMMGQPPQVAELPPQMMGQYQQPQMFPQQAPAQAGGFPMNYQQFPQTSQPEVPSVQTVQAHSTGHGFGGYTPQHQQSEVAVPPIPQQFSSQQPPLFQSPPQPGLQIPTQQTGHMTNPFRASMLMAASPPALPSLPQQQPQQPPAQKSTNPFARTTPATASPSSPLPTGTNPFARNSTLPPPSTSPQPTGGSGLSVPGGTNPFRASMMMQQQQAQQQAMMQGNFSGQTGTLGGLETLETVPVFPRTNPTGQQQQGW